MPSNVRPARLVPATSTPVELIGRSAVVGRVHELVRRAAGFESPILLVAEPGVNIESVAHDLHVRTRVAAAPWQVVDCAADGSQLDARLFGTPAEARGELESVAPGSAIVGARGGSLFLGDVTELPSSVQARLARVVRDGEVKLGSQRISTDVRLIAGALPSIDADVHDRRFRADLYRRLAATRIDLPPLRARPEDLPAIADRLLRDACALRGTPVRTFTEAARALLSALAWPGNLDELRAAIDQVVLHTTDAVIPVEQLLPALRLERQLTPFIPAGNLREARLRFEREYIAAVLQHHEWCMSEAAQTLGIQRPNLYRKARQLGIPVARTTDSHDWKASS